MKKIISVALAVIIIQNLFLFCIPVSASSSSASSGSGISGGGGFAGSVSTPVQVALAEYTVSGTIYLPGEMTAPEGGLKIYGGFGGVKLDEVAALSSVVSADAVEIDNTIKYEDYTVVAVIPEGKNYVTYSQKCKIAATYDGIYGKFWIYDSFSSGGSALSNKQTVSGIVKIKADVYEYKGLNCVFDSATQCVEYTITCDDVLKNENICTDVYVIADDGYDKYVSRVNISNGSDIAGGTLNLETDTEYTLYYYIPDSDDIKLQKLDKGLFEVGNLNIAENNPIVILSQNYISGTITLPDDYSVTSDITVDIYTKDSNVAVTIPQGQKSAEYVIGAFSQNGEYLKIVANDEHIACGYLTHDGTFEEYEYELWYTDEPFSVDNYDIRLREMYVICGKIFLPGNIAMEENTAFRVYVTAKNSLSGYSHREAFYIYSDTLCGEYKIPIAKEMCVGENAGEWTVCYDYGSYNTVSVPTSASSPLKSIKSPSSGGGGGGGSSSMVYKDDKSYTLQKPDGLLYDYRLYLGDTKKSFLEDTASTFCFSDKTITQNFTLASENDGFLGIITGYFENVLQTEIYTPVEIQLYDGENNLIKKKYIASDSGYYFDGLDSGSYKIGIKYNDSQYYYNNQKMVSSIDAAQVISLGQPPVKTHIDFFCDNVYSARIRISFDEIVINNCYYDVLPVKILDKYGVEREVSDTSENVTVGFSSFYIKIGDYFVSEYADYKSFVITRLTDSIEKALLINAEYYDSISMKFYEISKNRFCVEAYTELYNNPITETSYYLENNNICFSSVMNTVADGTMLIVAVYDDNNKLIDVRTEECTYGKSEYELTMPHQQDMSDAKIMVWNMSYGLMPLGIAEKLTVSADAVYDDFAKNVADVYVMAGKPYIYINNTSYDIDVIPYIENGIFYASARAVGEGLGWNLYWNDDERSITLEYNNQSCDIVVGSLDATYTCGDETKQIRLSAAPFMLNGRVLLPFGEIAPIFGYDVYVNTQSGIMAFFDGLNKKVKYAYDNNLLQSEKINFYSLNEYITRSEIASLLVSLYEESTGTVATPADSDTFYDTSDIDALKAYNLGILKGHADSSFNPHGKLTYAEAVTVVYRTVIKINEGLEDIYSSVPEYDNFASDCGHWAAESVYKSKKLGLLDDVCFDEIYVNDFAYLKDIIGIVANSYIRLN